MSGCQVVTVSFPQRFKKSHFQQFLDPKNDWERWCLHAAALPRPLRHHLANHRLKGIHEKQLWHLNGTSVVCVCGHVRVGLLVCIAIVCFLNDSDVLGIQCVYYIWLYGYGSIPINTIFSGMNIHLPAILMWGTRFWPIPIYIYIHTYYIDHFGIYTRVHPSNPRPDFSKDAPRIFHRDCPSQTKFIATW